jgi:thermitase
MSQRIASLFSALLAVVLFSVSSYARNPDQIPGEYLVKYRSHSFVSTASVGAMPFVHVMDNNSIGRILKVQVDMKNEVKAVASLLQNPNVEYVVPNVRVHMFRAPMNTTALKEQWAIKKVNAEAAWAKAGNRGSRNIKVAVIDTGADYKHEALAPNMIPGFDFITNSNDPMDKTSSANPGHGTHCSGIIGATGVVEGSIIGISPEVSIMPIRFLDENGSGDLNNGIKAIDYAIAQKVRVISASWGATIGRSQAMPLVEAVKRADDAGIIFVAAAANDGRNNDKTEVYPANANFPNSITVAASGSKDEKPSWSNYGKRTVHLASPGLDIMSTLPANKYGNLSGTSMATPLVSGLVAFLLSQDSTLTGVQMRALLQVTGAKVQIETAANTRVDALAAVDTILAKKLFVAPAAGSLKVGETMKFSGVYGSGNYTYASSNAAAGSIAADGTFTAAAVGDTTITVKDSSGATASSLTISVVDASQQPPDDGGGGGDPGMPNECPMQDPQMCQILCQIMPTAPWCNQ